MKKFLRNTVMAAAILGIAFGAASSADAYIQGLYEQNDSKYPLQMEDGVNLCYTHQSIGAYIDENSAKVVAEDGPIYTIAARFIIWNIDADRTIESTIQFEYDTDNHIMYSVWKDGSRHVVNRPTRESCGAEMRTGAMAIQVWHGAMGTDW